MHSWRLAASNLRRNLNIDLKGENTKLVEKVLGENYNYQYIMFL